MSDDTEDDYTVGYGRPPKNTQFKKGQPSPNPNGRPKKRALLSEAIFECLGEDVSVIAKDGTQHTMLAAKAVGKKVVGQAASGSISSQKLLLDLEKISGRRRPSEPEPAAPKPKPTPESVSLTLHLAKMIRGTYDFGLFEKDADGNFIPAATVAPLVKLFSALEGSKIQTAEQYIEARRNALAQAAEAFDDYAFDKLRTWQNDLQKSDLE